MSSTSSHSGTQAQELATFAGGCFWGMEELFRALPGVIDTEVGYTGGQLPRATYKDVKKGNTGHAESIRIQFDPSRITYKQLLDFFFRIHNPTTKDRQGNDIGTQYRSAIFFHSEEQEAAAEDFIARVDQSGAWPGPVVTEVWPVGEFWPAEPEHQDYLQKYPDGYTCHYVRKLPSFLTEDEQV
jgi:peptide-methionine (S)-S-oxide reductase